jgi:RNA-binding protein
LEERQAPREDHFVAGAGTPRMSSLSGKQRRHLRALGQRLDATLHVGHEGVTAAVVLQADAQLAAHELIKVRVGGNAPGDRHDVAEELARRTGAALAQVLGRTALLYRPRPEEPAIVLPP